MQAGSVVSISPSFNSYSNTRLAEIAARVVEEFGSEEFYDEFYFENEENSDYVERERENSVTAEENDKGEDEFEFAFVTRDSDLSSPISADEIFQNGQIRPVYPVFNRDLFLFQNGNGKQNGVVNSGLEQDPPVRLPLRKLFIEERETTMTMSTTSSCSSSEADDLDGVPEESYCVWRPKETPAAEKGCKKSSSTGSASKRWKFRDLLHRSHSDGGKDSFVFLSPSNSGRKKKVNEDRVKAAPVDAGKVKPAATPPHPPSMYNRDGGEKRRSYLPYRRDLVGLFGSANGLSKNLQPF